MPQSPHTYIIYPDKPNTIDTIIFAQNSQTGQIELEGRDATSIFLDTFKKLQTCDEEGETCAKGHSILVKAGWYLITSPLDLMTQMTLTFESGATLWVPNGYDKYVIGIIDEKQYIRVSGGFIREQGSPQRLWQGILMHESTSGDGNKIANNTIEGVEIWDADIAIKLLITHKKGWINGNLFRDIVMYRSNFFIDFDVQTPDNEAALGFNRNLFINIIGQVDKRDKNTEVGVRNIRHKANVFIDVKIWDIDKNTNGSNATIHPEASDTIILGGIMTAQNFKDRGRGTQIIDPFNNRQLFLNRLAIVPSDASDNSDTNAATLHFDGDEGNLSVGGNGRDGDILLFPSSATNNHDAAEANIHLNANSGEITFSNADCAEEFTIAEGVDATPGSVMVVNDNGLLQPSNKPYDKRVIGIISGAGKYKPGLLLDKKDKESNRTPITIMGKVYCMAIADDAPIETGDLLTTSHISGHAMKVQDENKAFGAIIGKALAPLTEGTSFIPVLVTLH